MDAKHFNIDNFEGRLGIGMSPSLVITDIPEASVCKPSGLPVDVVLTHINGFKVAALEDVRQVLTGLPAGTASVVLSVVPSRDDQRVWWAGVQGNIAAEAAAAADDDEEYDPEGEGINTNAGAAEEDEYDPTAEDDAAPPLPAAPPPPVAAPPQRKRAYSSESSAYNSSDCDEDDADGIGAPHRSRWGAKRARVDDAPAMQIHGGAGATAQFGATHAGSGGHGYGYNASGYNNGGGGGGGGTENGLHPCLRNPTRPRWCNATCPYRYLPENACTHLLSGRGCDYGEGCYFVHCRPLADPEAANYPFRCEPCGLRLEREADVTRHNASPAHTARVSRMQMAQSRDKAFMDRARSILDTL